MIRLYAPHRKKPPPQLHAYARAAYDEALISPRISPYLPVSPRISPYLVPQRRRTESCPPNQRSRGHALRRARP